MLICWGRNFIQIYNDAFRPINGKTKHPQALGGKASDTYSEIWDTIKPLFDKVMSGEAVAFQDFKLEMERQGYFEDLYFDFSYNPIKNEYGKALGILVICTETTEKVKSLQRLKESEERFRIAVEQAPVAITTFIGPDFVIDLYNIKMLEYWGRTAEQVKNKPVFTALPEAGGQGFEELLTNVYTKGKRFIANELPVRLFRNNRMEDTWINFTYEPLRDDYKKVIGIMVVCVEITDQVTYRKKLEENEFRLKMAVEIAELGVWSMDIDTGIFELNDRCRKIYGFLPEEPVNLEKIRATIEPKYLAGALEVFDEMIANKTAAYEHYIINQQTGQRLWIKGVGKLLDTDQSKSRISGIVLDLTHQKEVQQRKDDFIGIASHELKTPITSLKSSLQLLNALKEETDNKMLHKLIDMSNRSMDKISSLLDALLSYSQVSEGQMILNKTTFNISEIINNCCGHVIASNEYTLVLQGDKDVGINADEHRVEQVVVNLVNNAIKYAPDSKTIYIIIERYASFIKLSVKDNGPGIPEDQIPHLFERYYRIGQSDKYQSGLGLGLYISSEIIKRHGGEIGVISKLGEGSTFWFTLPID